MSIELYSMQPLPYPPAEEHQPDTVAMPSPIGRYAVTNAWYGSIRLPHPPAIEYATPPPTADDPPYPPVSPGLAGSKIAGSCPVKSCKTDRTARRVPRSLSSSAKIRRRKPSSD